MMCRGGWRDGVSHNLILAVPQLIAVSVYPYFDLNRASAV